MNDKSNTLFSTSAFIQDALIVLISFVICVVISFFTNVSFVWLLIPLILLILLAYLSHLLRNRFGKTYGIVGYLFIFFLIPTLWYLFSSTMPMRSAVLEYQKNLSDLESFKDYPEGVDAKKQIASYQFKKDSLLNLAVAELLEKGLVDSAMALVKENELKSRKLKDELFKSSLVEEEAKKHPYYKDHWSPPGSKEPLIKPHDRSDNLEWPPRMWLFKGQKYRITADRKLVFYYVSNIYVNSERRTLEAGDVHEDVMPFYGTFMFWSPGGGGKVATLEVIE